MHGSPYVLFHIYISVEVIIIHYMKPTDEVIVKQSVENNSIENKVTTDGGMKQELQKNK